MGRQTEQVTLIKPVTHSPLLSQNLYQSKFIFTGEPTSDRVLAMRDSDQWSFDKIIS